MKVEYPALEPFRTRPGVGATFATDFRCERCHVWLGWTVQGLDPAKDGRRTRTILQPELRRRGKQDGFVLYGLRARARAGRSANRGSAWWHAGMGTGSNQLIQEVNDFVYPPFLVECVDCTMISVFPRLEASVSIAASTEGG